MLLRKAAVCLLLAICVSMWVGCAERRHYLFRRQSEGQSMPVQQAPDVPQPAVIGSAPASTAPAPAPQAHLGIPATPSEPSAAVQQPAQTAPTPPQPAARGAAPAPPTDPAVVQASATVAVQGGGDPPVHVAPQLALYQRAAERYATMDSYIARLKRREEVHGRANPEELLLVKFRKQPWSVYFKWIGTEGQGREVVYVKGQYGNMIHTVLAPGDHPFMAGGKRMSVAPDNVFIRSKTRHSIQDAGIGSIIERYGALIDAIGRGTPGLGAVSYLGRQKRPEYEDPMEVIQREIPPGSEPQLPRGGRRWLFFDSVSGLPVLTITHDDRDREVEYYCYDRIQSPVRLDDDDFNPDKLWPTRR